MLEVSGDAWKGPCQVVCKRGSGIKKECVLSKRGVWEEVIWLKKLIKKQELYQKKRSFWRMSLKRRSLIEKRMVFFQGIIISRKSARLEIDPFYKERFWLLRKSRTKGFEKERRIKSHESCFERGNNSKSVCFRRKNCISRQGVFKKEVIKKEEFDLKNTGFLRGRNIWLYEKGADFLEKEFDQ